MRPKTGRNIEKSLPFRTVVVLLEVTFTHVKLRMRVSTFSSVSTCFLCYRRNTLPPLLTIISMKNGSHAYWMPKKLLMCVAFKLRALRGKRSHLNQILWTCCCIPNDLGLAKKHILFASSSPSSSDIWTVECWSELMWIFSHTLRTSALFPVRMVPCCISTLMPGHV